MWDESVYLVKLNIKIKNKKIKREKRLILSEKSKHQSSKVETREVANSKKKNIERKCTISFSRI